MLKPVVDIAVPALAVLAMAVVGLNQTVNDFRRVARRPGVVASATVGQFLALPRIGLALVWWLPVAACPAGSMTHL